MPIASLYASASRLLSSLLVIRSSFLVSRWFAGMDVSAASSAYKWSGVRPWYSMLSAGPVHEAGLDASIGLGGGRPSKVLRYQGQA